MWPTIKLVFLTAIRDRLFTALAGLLIVAAAGSLFLSSAALVEQEEAAVVYAAGTVRTIIVFGVLIFIALQIQRLFESREIEAILSRSVSRPAFVFAYWIGCVGLSTVLIIPLAVGIMTLSGSEGAAAVWGATLWFEVAVVASFVIFAAFTFERATTTIFATAAFYGFCRLLGFFIGIREATPMSGSNLVVNPLLDVLTLILPRLDLLSQTRWLVYGLQDINITAAIIAQAVAFIAVALCATIFDLIRKQF